MKNFTPVILGFKSIILMMLILPMIASAAAAVVEIDTGTEVINALEGSLILPENIHIDDIQTGNSAILMWISSPKQVEDTTITFAGITPGGFAGTYPIFTIQGEFNAQDLGKVRFGSTSALKNDGSGMSVSVRMSLSLVEMKADLEPPEDFTPAIANDPNVFDGKYFLVFATQDKGAGVAHFQVREGQWGWFRTAESPYLLKSQKLDKDIYVKAIDNAGNERVAVLAARVHKSWWEEAGLFAILIVMVLFAIAYKK